MNGRELLEVLHERDAVEHHVPLARPDVRCPAMGVVAGTHDVPDASWASKSLPLRGVRRVVIGPWRRWRIVLARGRHRANQQQQRQGETSCERQHRSIGNAKVR